MPRDVEFSRADGMDCTFDRVISIEKYSGGSNGHVPKFLNLSHHFQNSFCFFGFDFFHW